MAGQENSNQYEIGASMAYGKFRVPEADEFQTPEWCAKLMAQMIPVGSNILEPTPGNGNLVRAAEKRGTVIALKDFFSEIGSYPKFDCVIMNPPFSPMPVGYKILEHCMTTADRIVALMPWLSIINSERRTARL